MLEICNNMFRVNKNGFSYLLAPNDTFLACSTGLTWYIIIQDFINNRDYCVLVQLFPNFSIHESDDLLKFWDRGASLPSHHKREPISAVTLAVLLGLGAAGTGTGIAALVSSQQNARNYHLLNEAISQDIENIKRGLDDLTDSLVSLSEVALQNRRGLDLLFLQQGGLCAALKEECCVYVDKTGLVKDSIAKVTASLEKRKREREQQESWYQNWFSTSPWLSTLLPSLLGPLLGLLLLISFGPWAFQKLTRFVKSQIDSSLSSAFVSVHYHWLDVGDNKQVTGEEADADAASSPSSRGERLNFHKMLK